MDNKQKRVSKNETRLRESNEKYPNAILHLLVDPGRVWVQRIVEVKEDRPIGPWLGGLLTTRRNERFARAVRVERFAFWARLGDERFRRCGHRLQRFGHLGVGGDEGPECRGAIREDGKRKQ